MNEKRRIIIQLTTIAQELDETLANLDDPIGWRPSAVEIEPPRKLVNSAILTTFEESIQLSYLQILALDL
jgi:hypothetical protein